MALPPEGCYSGGFAFDVADEEPHQLQPAHQQRRHPEGAQPPPLPPAAAATAAEPPPHSTGGPPRLLYIQSSRLAQLSALLPVNQDRPALVHSLIEAYGLLQVWTRLVCAALQVLPM